MPRGDRTGPAGMGPLTGRGAGYCAGFAVPGFANCGGGGFGRMGGRGAGMGGRGAGMGFRARMGQGFGFGWGAANTGFGPTAYPTGVTEQSVLQDQAEALKSQLDAIQQRLSDLEKGD